MSAEVEVLFADDAPLRGRVARCVVCGAPRSYRIQVQIAQVGSGGKPIQGRTRSVSATVCDEHAGEMWERVAAALAP